MGDQYSKADKSNYVRDGQAVDSKVLCKLTTSASAALPFELPQQVPQRRPDCGNSPQTGQPFEFIQHFQIVGCETDSSGFNDLPHGRKTVTGFSQPSTPAFPVSRSGSAVQPDSGSTDEIITTVPLGGNFTGLQICTVADGKVSASALLSLSSVWNYLSAQEAAETDWSRRDDLRISKLCILEADSGNPDPWRTAFWKYMGITPEKFQGILAERNAYAATLGKTLAQELEDPAFLASLDPDARPYYAFPQMKLEFKPQPVQSLRKKRAA